MTEAGPPVRGGAAGDVGSVDRETKKDDGLWAGGTMLDLFTEKAQEVKDEDETELLESSPDGDVANEEDRGKVDLTSAPATCDDLSNRVFLCVKQMY